jgi:hypothetical protein
MVLACVKQVQKDLGMFGIELHFSGQVMYAYDELFSQLQPELERLIFHHSNLPQILYRVDVSEEQVKKIMLEDEPYSYALTRLILWRELQKVVTRYLMSTK